MEIVIFTAMAVLLGFINWLVLPIMLGLVVAVFALVIWSVKTLLVLIFGGDDNG